MKRFGLLMSIFLVFTLVLAACAPDSGNEVNGVDGVGTPMGTDTLGEPLGTEDLGDIEPTPYLQETPDEPLATAPVAETETVEPTEAITGTVDATEAVTDTTSLPSTGALNPALVSNLMDYDVCSTAEGDDVEELGDVNDLILDFRATSNTTGNIDSSSSVTGTTNSNANQVVLPGKGRISYIVVGAGGVLGIGEDNVLVPWKAVNLRNPNADDNIFTDPCFYINMNEEALQNAPSVDLDTLDFESDNWDNEARTYWETELGDLRDVGDDMDESDPNNEVGQENSNTGQGLGNLERAFRASEFFDMSLLDTAGEDLGTLSDLVVDINSGRILYAVIEAGGVLEVDGLVLVPIEMLSVDMDGNGFTLPTDAGSLEDVPTFADDDLTDLNNPGWDSDLRVYWNNLWHPETNP